MFKSWNIACIRHVWHIWLWMLLVEILDYVKSALVDIEVDIPLFKIRSTSLPDYRIRMQLFNRRPYCLPNTASLRSVPDIEEIQMVMLCSPVYLNNGSAYHFSITHDFISNSSGF